MIIVAVSSGNKGISIEHALMIILTNARSDPHSQFVFDGLAGTDPETKRAVRLASIRAKLLSCCRDGNIVPCKKDGSVGSFNYDGDVEQDKEFEISLEEFGLFSRLYGFDDPNDRKYSPLCQSIEAPSNSLPISVHVPPHEPSEEKFDENEPWDPEIAEGLRANEEKKKARLKKTIPGILPITRIGRLAVKIAWEIEVDTGEQAACKVVMERLCKLAATINESDSLDADADCLVCVDTSVLGKESVVWRTENGDEKSYGQATCKQTLWNWHKSLPQKKATRR